MAAIARIENMTVHAERVSSSFRQDQHASLGSFFADSPFTECCSANSKTLPALIAVRYAEAQFLLLKVASNAPLRPIWSIANALARCAGADMRTATYPFGEVRCAKRVPTIRPGVAVEVCTAAT